MAPHSSTLAWKIPWTEEHGRLQSMGSLRVGHNWATSLSLHFHALEKEMATHSSVLAWKIPWTEDPPLGFAPSSRLKIHICVLPSCQVRFPICMEPRFYGPSLCRCTLLGDWKLCPFRGHLLSGPMTLLLQMALFTVISMILYIINGEKLKPTCRTDSINF